MKLHLVGMIVLGAWSVAGCGGDPSVPTAAELYGVWRGTADGVTREFQFAATDDGSHAELAGVSDIYLLASGGTPVQTGHYSVEERAVNDHGTTDALVTQPLSGAGTGSTYGNAILDWTGTTLTISSETATGGQLVLAKQP